MNKERLGGRPLVEEAELLLEDSPDPSKAVRWPDEITGDCSEIVSG